MRVDLGRFYDQMNNEQRDFSDEVSSYRRDAELQVMTDAARR